MNKNIGVGNRVTNRASSTSYLQMTYLLPYLPTSTLLPTFYKRSTTSWTGSLTSDWTSRSYIFTISTSTRPIHLKIPDPCMGDSGTSWKLLEDPCIKILVTRCFSSNLLQKLNAKLKIKKLRVREVKFKGPKVKV